MRLADPPLTHAPPTPEQMLERAHDRQLAFVIMLALLALLALGARAAILLCDAFDTGYDEPPYVPGKNVTTCCQIGT